MRNQKVLEKAIQKAIDGGWEVGKQIKHTKDMGWVQDSGGELKVTKTGVSGSMRQLLGESDIIYDKGFAKALWGEEPYKLTVHDVNTPSEYANSIMVQQPMWSYRLQQMVIADDPIAYLGKNI